MSFKSAISRQPTDRKMIYLDGEALKAALIEHRLTNRDFLHKYNNLREIQLADFPRARLLDDPSISNFLHSKPQSSGRRASTHTATIMAAVFGLSDDFFVLPSKKLEGEIEDKESIVFPDTKKAKIRIGDSESDNAIHDRIVADQKFAELPYISVRARTEFVKSGGQIASYPFHDIRRIYLRGVLPDEYFERVVFEVDDDSMEPYINRGDEVVAVGVSVRKWNMVQNGVFAVCFGGDMMTIKKIINNDLMNKDTLMLLPWRGELAPLTIHRDEIHSIFRIEKVLPQAFSIRL